MKRFLSLLVSEDGQVSSGRVLSVMFGLLTCLILSALAVKEFRSQDPAMVGAVAGSLAFWGPTLLSLVSGPYAITKGSAALGDVVEKLRK